MATLACEGCFVGYPAVLSLLLAFVLLIGSIYMLLASNFGARKGYLILMVSLMGWMIILSSIWLFGLPGTTPSTGPRAREAQWIPFVPTSPVGREDFPAEIARFPGGWDEIGETYPGKVESKGELETVRAAVTAAEARLAAKNKAPATDAKDWQFRIAGQKPTTRQEEKVPAAEVRFLQKGNTLLFGARIPATDKHAETLVFAYRDKGVVFLYGLLFLGVSLVGFVAHVWFLGRLERREKAERARLEPAPA